MLDWWLTYNNKVTKEHGANKGFAIRINGARTCKVTCIHSYAMEHRKR